MTTATQPLVMLTHPTYRAQVDLAARYVVDALHRTQNVTVRCDVVLPARIMPSSRRAATERLINAQLGDNYHVPSRGTEPWYVSHDEADEF